MNPGTKGGASMLQKTPPGFVLIFLIFLIFAAFVGCIRFSDRDVAYLPTPQETVELMLEVAAVGPEDVVYDLGSGDGRIPITAVTKFGAKKSVGVDIDPGLVRESVENARVAGVGDRVEFHEGNVFTFDFSEASVVTMYLLTEINIRLRPRILDELRPGTRVVSHQFRMGDWEPDRYAYSDTDAIYFWVVPAKVAGGWSLALYGKTYRLDLDQQFQKVSGEIRADDGWRAPIDRVELRGRELGFSVSAEQPWSFEGRVTENDTIEGTLSIGDRTHVVAANRVD